MLKDYMSHRNLKKIDTANILGIPQSAIYTYEKSASLQTANLLRFCHALKYNFFMDIANSLPREYNHSELLVSEKDTLIASQTAEIQKLKMENELLKDLISRKS